MKARRTFIKLHSYFSEAVSAATQRWPCAAATSITAVIATPPRHRVEQRLGQRSRRCCDHLQDDKSLSTQEKIRISASFLNNPQDLYLTQCLLCAAPPQHSANHRLKLRSGFCCNRLGLRNTYVGKTFLFPFSSHSSGRAGNKAQFLQGFWRTGFEPCMGAFPCFVFLLFLVPPSVRFWTVLKLSNNGEN